MTETLSVALWATNLAVRLNGIGAWAAGVEERMVAAKNDGADILVMPEYAAEQWLSFAPQGLAPDKEIPWLAERAPEAYEVLAPLAARHGIALLAGTMPVAAPKAEPGQPPYLNRAWLFLPDGRAIAQDKLCLTPGERDPKAWNLTTGETIEIVEWNGLRLATLICLDVEMPALSNLLAPHDIDVLLVPSMTEKLSGYSRVFSCAKARAVELQAAVCAVGTIGATQTGKGRAGNTSGASAFVPCEEILGYTGTWAEIAPRDRVAGPGPVLYARDLPIGKIRKLRQGAAEVWPGAWRADHVRVSAPAQGTISPMPSRAAAGS
jgi:predicted amidohydrolase